MNDIHLPLPFLSNLSFVSECQELVACRHALTCLLMFVLQAAMISEMVAVEVDTQVGCLGHMVDVAVVEAHTTAAEEITLTMRDMILVMMLPNGIQLPKMAMMVGVAAEAAVEVAVGVEVVVGVVVVATVGVVVLVQMTVMAGVVEAVMLDDGAVVGEGMLVVPQGLLGGVLTLKKVQHN